MNLQQCLDFFVAEAEDATVPLRQRLKRFEVRIRLMEVLHAAQQRKNADLVGLQLRSIVAELPQPLTLDEPVPVVARRDLGRLVGALYRIRRSAVAELLREQEDDARRSVRAKFHELAQRRERAEDAMREQIEHELLGLLNSVPDRSWVPTGIHVKVFITEVRIANKLVAREWLAAHGFQPNRRCVQKDLKIFLGKLIDDGVSLPEGVIAVNIGWAVTA